MVRKAGNASQKRPLSQWDNGNPLEVLKDLALGVGRDFTDDFIKGTANDFLSETGALFGLKPDKKVSGTLSPDEVLDLSTLKPQPEETKAEDRRVRPEAVFRPPQENFLFLENEKNIEHQIEALLSEIKKEVKRFDEATQNLEREAAKIVVEDIPPNPGVYHINFFAWLLGLLRNLRQEVEDAGAWVTALQSKKAKKGYWAKFKKHGTSFGLSGERVVATQTG